MIFSFQFRKIITQYRRIGYNLNVMRQSACLVFNRSKTVLILWFYLFLALKFLVMFPIHIHLYMFTVHIMSEKVQVGKDQEKAQSEKDSHSKNRGGKKPN